MTPIYFEITKSKVKVTMYVSTKSASAQYLDKALTMNIKFDRQEFISIVTAIDFEATWAKVDATVMHQSIETTVPPGPGEYR